MQNNYQEKEYFLTIMWMKIGKINFKKNYPILNILKAAKVTQNIQKMAVIMH